MSLAQCLNISQSLYCILETTGKDQNNFVMFVILEL